jgi:glycosyltransferase involved in cell wall biosynthesis
MYDIYVVCNGCTDRTREVAQGYDGIVVMEIEGAGKHLALNEGDRLSGDTYPRLYCDADIQISAASITALVEALTTDDVRAAGPSVRFDVKNSTWTVKLFYRALESSTTSRWLSGHLVGRGLYGASRAARQRFGYFPALFADDLFFDSQFNSSEKVTLLDAEVTLWVPANLRDLIRGEVRVAQGNQQYGVAKFNEGRTNDPVLKQYDELEATPETHASEWRSSLKGLRTRDVFPVLFHLGILATARTILAAKKLRGHEIHWR